LSGRKLKTHQRDFSLKGVSHVFAATISGPVSFVIGDLSGHATLLNMAATTTCAEPIGSPYIKVDVGINAVFDSRERATLTLEFNNPSAQAITYTPRILARPGNR
jgi:hypothetical protein